MSTYRSNQTRMERMGRRTALATRRDHPSPSRSPHDDDGRCAVCHVYVDADEACPHGLHRWCCREHTEARDFDRWPITGGEWHGGLRS